MITLIYGDDGEQVEKSVVNVIADKKITRIDAKKIAIKELEETLLGNSLFGEESTFVIENIFKNKKKKELLEFITHHRSGLSVLLVERQKLTKRDAGLIKADTLLEHLLPQFYFKFLDDLYPRNGRALVIIYQNLLQSMTADQIFYSMVKRVRALLAVKSGVMGHSEIARMAPWQLGKLKRQASLWDEKKLISFYNQLFLIEKRMKSSQLSMNLAEYIDIMVLTELH